MPGKERTRRPGDGQLDLTALLEPDHRNLTEDQAQDRMRACADALATTHAHPDAHLWADSPYRWIRDLATSSKSKAAERLVASYLAAAGTVITPGAAGHSFTVGTTRVKVRMSMQWTGGDFVFQQIRTGDYDQLCLLGVAPQRIHLWLLPAETAAANLDPATGWLAFPAARPPAWLVGHGGDLRDTVARFRQLAE